MTNICKTLQGFQSFKAALAKCHLRDPFDFRKQICQRAFRISFGHLIGDDLQCLFPAGGHPPFFADKLCQNDRFAFRQVPSPQNRALPPSTSSPVSGSLR